MANGADSSAALGTLYQNVTCALTITGLDASAVRVASFTGRERLSALFAYSIVVATSPDDVANLEKALGSDVSLEVQRDGAFERGVHGILTEVAPDGTYVGKNQVRTRLLVEPRLANLRYSGGFKMFQKKSVKDIIGALVSPERIDVVWRLRPAPPPRDYRTQLNESDLAFLARLAADEGLHFFFESTQDKTSLVFTNSPKGFQAIDGTSSLPYREVGGATTTDHVRAIQREKRVRTGAVEHRDYDFTNPRVALVGRFETPGDQGEANTTRREWRDYPGGFLDPDAEGTPRAQMRLEELRSDASVVMGTASTLRLVAGKKFTLTGHTDTAFNGDLVVTEVTVGGTVESAFDGGGGGGRGQGTAEILARFNAAPADTPLRPRRLDKPPSRLQTARVVGPTDGDPNVDNFGRINVQFMWDRDGKFDANSSCWIRMATPNAHGNEGFWQAHRVGSEVLVDFIDGDIDRPVVIAALYNGKETQPYAQPGGVTRSTWKTRGIPGGSGFNEITFENSSGNEQIILHAQKDLNETILNDHNETIGTNQTSGIGSNQSITVGKDRSLSVGNNETISIGSNQSVTIGSNQTISIGSNQSTTIGASQTDSVGSTRTTTVGSDDSTTIMGNATRMVAQADTVMVAAARSVTVGGAEALTVIGSRAKTVGGSETTTVAGDRTETVGGAESVTVSGARSVNIGDASALDVEKAMAITVKEDFALKVGDNITVTMSKDGDIEIKTGDASLSMKKDGTVDIKGKGVTVEASSDATLKGDNVILKGSKVGLN
jgi:type VI secretion system secreted protein VgrG